MTTKNTKTNNLTIVRNVAYSQIKKMKKNIKEIVEVDKNFLDIIDINMKNAINKIINDYKLSARLENVNKVVKDNPTMSMFKQSQLIKKMNKGLY